jgi:hypothetical protein
MFALLFDANRSQDLDRFLDDTIKPLVTYDTRHTVLGEDWRTPERALRLHVALQLHG